MYADCSTAFDVKINEIAQNTFNVNLIYNGKGFIPESALPRTTGIDPLEVTTPTSASLQDPKLNQHSTQTINLTSLKNARDLALAVKKEIDEPLINSIIKSMIDIFYGIDDPRSEQLEEMVALAEICDKIESQEQKRIVQKLLKILKDSIFTDTNTLSALAKIYKMIQRAHNKQAVKKVKDSKDPLENLKENPLYQYEMDALVQMVNVLSDKLLGTTRATSSHDLSWYMNNNSSNLILAQLEAFTALLELMEKVKLNNLEREDFHGQFYKALDKFSFDPNLKIAFQADYGKQILATIPTGESALHEILRHSASAVKGGIALHKLISDVDLDKIEDSILDFKEALTFDDALTFWYWNLYNLRTNILSVSVKYIKKLKREYDEGF